MFLWEKLRLLLPWNRRERERSLDDELQSHLELARDDALADGAAREDAGFAARRDLGSPLRVREETRRVWGWASWDRLKQDFTYSMRTLRKARTFTTVSVLSLALGIGSATAIFSLVNTVLLKPLSYPEPGQLVSIREVVPGLASMYPSLPANYQHFRFWREHVRSFDSIAAIEGGGIMDLTGADPVRLDIAMVSTNLFHLLGVRPQIGRAFLPEEGTKGHAHVTVITNALWQSRFGSNPAIVGHTISVNDTPYTVVGVLPPGFRFPKGGDLGPLTELGKNTQLFLPLTDTYTNDWDGDYDYLVFGRLKPNLTVQQAAAELDMLETQIGRQYRLGAGLRVTCTRLEDVIAMPMRTPLYVLLAAVLLLLAIVCLNLANLVLARSTVRAREFSIRTALGAGRSRLIQQLVIEMLLLGIGGGALGLALATLGIHTFVTHTSLAIPRLDEVQLDGRVLVFSIVVSFACGFLSGVVSALRIAKADAHDALRAGTHTIAGSRVALRTREALIGAEVAMSVILLFGAGLMTSSLIRLLNIDKGFTTEQAVAVEIVLPYPRYKADADYARFWDRGIEQLSSIPGVESAAFASKLPLTGESMVDGIVLEGSEQPVLDPASRDHIEINVRYVSPEYFQTLGIPLLRGRFIDAHDRPGVVAVVSERLAAKVWPHRNPLGQSFSTGAGVGKAKVIGVVKDVHATALDQEPTMIAYVPYWHRGLSYADLVVRTARDPTALIPEIHRRIRALDPSLPVPTTLTIDKLVSESLSRRYFQLRLAAAFAGAALTLALIGIYGLVAYNTAQRRTEIAIRLAIGATRTDVLRAVLVRGLRPIFIGLLIGLPCAALVAQLIRKTLYGVKATDPLTMIAVAALLVVTALCACLLPGRAAVRTDPASALRYE